MNKRASVNDILIHIQAVAVEHNINLTYTNKMIFLKLIDFVEENSSADLPLWIRCNITTLALANYCSVSPRMITDTLHKLDECHIIKYIARKKNSSVVTIYKKYYIADNEI